MKQYYTNDEMQVLEAVARSTQPIVITGAEGSGKSILSNILNELSNFEKLVFDTNALIGETELENAIKHNEDNLNKSIISTTKVSKQLLQFIGSHVQLKVYALDNGTRTFKLNYVKVPKTITHKITLTGDKNTAIVYRDSTPSKSLIEVSLSEKDYMNKGRVQYHITAVEHLIAVTESMTHLNLIKQFKGLMFQVGATEQPHLIVVLLESIKKDFKTSRYKNEEVISYLKNLKEQVDKGNHYLVLVETDEDYSDSISFDLDSFDLKTIFDFRTKEDTTGNEKGNLAFNQAVRLIKTHTHDVAIINDTNEMSTRLYDFFTRNPLSGMAQINMDSYYSKADELDNLIQNNERVMITTKNQNTAYLAMLSNPLIIAVNSFKDEDLTTVTGECIVPDLNTGGQ